MLIVCFDGSGVGDDDGDCSVVASCCPSPLSGMKFKTVLFLCECFENFSDVDFQMFR